MRLTPGQQRKIADIKKITGEDFFVEKAERLKGDSEDMCRTINTGSGDIKEFPVRKLTYQLNQELRFLRAEERGTKA